MKRILLTLTAVFCASFGLRAGADAGIWSSLQAVKSFKGGAYAMARFEHRSCEKMSETECWFAMAGGGAAFTDWLKADLSYEYWKIQNTSVAHKAVLAVTGTLRKGDFAFQVREKYELAYAPASEALTHTLRTRFRFQYSGSAGSLGLTPYAMMEVFNGPGSTPWIRNLHYLGCELGFGKHHSIDLFYMYHLWTTGSSHLLGVGYNFRF